MKIRTLCGQIRIAERGKNRAWNICKNSFHEKTRVVEPVADPAQMSANLRLAGFLPAIPARSRTVAAAQRSAVSRRALFLIEPICC